MGNKLYSLDEKMEKKYFSLDENFEEIIKNALKEHEIKEMHQISTGWTNIVYEVETNDGNYFLRFPRDDFYFSSIVKRLNKGIRFLYLQIGV